MDEVYTNVGVLILTREMPRRDLGRDNDLVVERVYGLEVIMVSPTCGSREVTGCLKFNSRDDRRLNYAKGDLHKTRYLPFSGSSYNLGLVLITALPLYGSLPSSLFSTLRTTYIVLFFSNQPGSYPSMLR